MKIDEIPIWEAFLAVAKHGNFSNASRALNISVPQLSKRVVKLEDGLNVRLFQRSTRSVTLTSEGQELLPKVISIIEDFQNIESEFTKEQEISGTIRLTCVPFVAHKFLAPLIEEFLQNHPKIKIQLELSTQFINLIESGIDMAIRIETPKDSEMIYRKLAPNKLIFCASPTYLKTKKAVIKKPEDLKNHEILMLPIHHRCKFENSNIKLGNFKTSKKVICEDGEFLTNMALNDSGILVRSYLDVKKELESKKLTQVLKNHPLEIFGHLYAVTPSKRYLAPRVRAFLNLVLSEAKCMTP